MAQNYPTYGAKEMEYFCSNSGESLVESCFWWVISQHFESPAHVGIKAFGHLWFLPEQKLSR